MTKDLTDAEREQAARKKKRQDKLEAGHLREQPEPLSRSTPSEALGRLPSMDLIK